MVTWMPRLDGVFSMRSLKLLRDPLLHFVVAGAILFAGYELINRGELTRPRLVPSISVKARFAG